MIRTYVAAPFRRKEMVRQIAEALFPHGYAVRARWLDHAYQQPGGIHNPDNAEYAKFSAEEDWEDSLNADLMVVLMEPHEGSHYGWLVELGIGLALAHEVWLVGPVVNVFPFLEGEYKDIGCTVRHFATTDDLFAYLNKETLNVA